MIEIHKKTLSFQIITNSKESCTLITKHKRHKHPGNGDAIHMQG